MADDPETPANGAAAAEEEDDSNVVSRSGRARRTTAKKVDYSREQEFSDQDLFEDSPDERPAPSRPSSRRKGGGGGSRRKKRSNTPPVGGGGSSTLTQQQQQQQTMYDEDGGGEEYASKPVYTEKGYDPTLLPIRERIPFLPENEEDGSPKIELIVGRRPVDEKEDSPEDEDETENSDDEDDDDEEDEEEEAAGSRRTRRRSSASKKKRAASSPSSPGAKADANAVGPAEYEYLIKYKGRSYLHLEWKTGADLESMNKSAKGIYRRYLKKLAQGTDDDLENPEFDPSFAVPEKIVDEKEQEIQVELTDKELLKWEKQREKELAAADDDDDSDDDEEEDEKASEPAGKEDAADKPSADATEGIQPEEEKKEASEPLDDDWDEGDIDFSKLTIDKLRAVVNRDGTYYPTIEGSDNPYRDGYIKDPPKKPRASYLFFQWTFRSYFQKKHPNLSQQELMIILGDVWRGFSDDERRPFIELANEEAKQYEKEKALMEKAQKPNEVWQPIRRCKMVLDRIADDSFAEIFLEPVDTTEFTDYEEVIDLPMDLGTVRTKLNNRKYQAAEQFARDMRRIWNNCKIFNQHGSAIWHVADYMSKQFERLHHAWVLDFRERYLRWADPRARPWEQTCRKHDGKCGTPEDQIVKCDHCDAPFGFKCVDPPLSKKPKKGWHCPDCKPRLRSVRGTRMLSAVAENAARKRAELGDLPRKKINQTMYLVKWAGLGYEFCTWETRVDVNDDRLISQFHRLNNSLPDEADMPEEMVDRFLSNTKHLNVENAGGVSCIPSLRAQLYAQSRALQFVKFGADVPDLVCSECGPRTKASAEAPSSDHPSEVVECLSDIVSRVSRKLPADRVRSNTDLPPPMTAEYDAIVPVTSKGLMMNVGEMHGSVAFLGYRTFADGSKGPAELANLIRNVGDKIIAVDGVSTVGMSFKDVISLLRESGKNKFSYMRFLENRFGSGMDFNLVSVGTVGRYAIEELQKKFTSDRKRMIVQRTQKLLKEEEENPEDDDSDASSEAAADSGEDSDEGSEGEFQPDSDDEEIRAAREPSPEKKPTQENSEAQDAVKPAPDAMKVDNAQDATQDAAPADPASSAEPIDPGTIFKQETTRSLAYRLLDIDVGYSSDEGGDDDRAYFLDGVDSTFTTIEELSEHAPPKKTKGKKQSKDENTLPARQNEFSTMGDRAKLTSAVALTTKPPQSEDFDHFPYPSTKQIEAAVKEEEEAQLHSPSPTKGKRSTVKVEQISVATGELVHIWANIESAAATLQLPLPQLRQVLRGEYDEDIGDEVGGHKWRYALAGAKVTAGTSSSTGGGGGKKAKEAWLEFRDKLYDPAEPHSYKNGNRLRDYQVDGVNWLASTWYKRQGCILADEMGLGKTVQIVCYIEHLFRVEKFRRPFLVVVPLSTVEHWRRELEGWTDMVCCIYHDRQRVWRDVLREYEWYYEDRPHTPEFLKFDVLVTTYDTLIGDFEVIKEIPFRVAVVDEAHRLRNQKGKLLECMREISAKGTMHYGFQSRVLMSGTPLQNDLTELWTLLNFIEPFKFPDLDDFYLKFGNMANKDQVESLQRMISPFMLRRVKEDVAKDIPAKEETVIDVELTSIQKQYYRAIFEHNHAFLNIGATRQSAPKLMNIQMELRKVCNHPFLLEGVEHRETERLYKEFLESGKFDGKTPEEQQRMLNEFGYIMSSGKMVLLDKLLPKLRQEGHKVLIFSQMVKMLDLISEYCEFRSFPYERLDGRIRGTERQKAIDRFEREKDSFIFLLSTRAGGVGINLTAADICILHDSDWNPQNDIQAQARCHRIGQTKDVRIYRLVTSRSFEQEMFDRASKKLGLEQAVLGTFEKDKEDDKPSNEEMEQLLKKGAYALLEDDDQKTKEFCADDIESILAKRTRTRVVEGAKTSSWLNKQGMVVSKSKFTAEDGEQVDMDDPLFWQKVMPDFVTPSILLQKLNDLQDEIDGKVRGPGRGRGRRKKSQSTENTEADEKKEDDNKEGEEKKDEKNNNAPEDNKDEAMDVDAATSNAEEKENKEEDVEAADGANAQHSNEKLDEASEGENEDDDEEEKPQKKQLSRTHIRKVHKFMSELKSMMESIFEEDDDEALSKDEKAICQKLLLTISVKEKLFNDDQRRLARAFLKRIEGDRRRRCRTSEQPRFNPGVNEDDAPASAIPEELMIRGKKKPKKKRRKLNAEADDTELEVTPIKRSKKSGSGGTYLGEDGYLHHSDSEADWSDVGEDIYMGGTKKRDKISQKEARRRRQWAGNDDAASAAGRPWPVFPRHVVRKVLDTVLDEVIKYDEENGGVFSVPVPKGDFPEYYEQIKHPMDYGTMKTKLENGEYRSAQAMQKDFVLILQNCRQFNATSSDIVKEARQQHLMRPKILKEAAIKHKLFLAEDGTVLEILDEPKKGSAKKQKRTRRGKGHQPEDAEDEENGGEPVPRKKKTRKKKAKEEDDSEADAEGEEEEPVPRKKKSRKKKAKEEDAEENSDDEKSNKKGESTKKKSAKKTKQTKRKRKAADSEEAAREDDEDDKASSQAGKPRIKIKVNAEKTGKGKKAKARTGKRKRSAEPEEIEEAEDEGADGDVETTPIPRKKRPKKDHESSAAATTASRRGGAKNQATENGNENADPSAIFLDPSVWKEERDSLDGSFAAAWKFFTKRGPWKLPSEITDRFSEVALATLSKMDRYDRYHVFTEAVSDTDAPGYSDIVTDPMDFGTMRGKVQEGEYGRGSLAAAAFYGDFLLVFDNCRLYNTDDSDVTEEAARLLALLPETYVAACVSAAKKK